MPTPIPVSVLSAQPNILLLMPDQWRWDWDGAAHAHTAQPTLKLPNIQRLRDGGTSFPRGAIVPAPVCAPSRSCMASLREYDHAGTATNGANDFRAGSIPTYFSALQDAGYHTMTTGKDDLTKATQLGYKLGHDTRNASDTYHAAALGFSDSIRFSGKMDVLSSYPRPHEAYGYHLNESVVHLADGTAVNAFRAHRACLGGAKAAEAALCERSSFLAALYEDDWTARQAGMPTHVHPCTQLHIHMHTDLCTHTSIRVQAVTLLQRAPRDKPWFLWVSFPGPHPPFLVTGSIGPGVF